MQNAHLTNTGNHETVAGTRFKKKLACAGKLDSSVTDRL